MYPEQTICFDFNSKLKSRHKKALNFMHVQHPPLDVASDTNNNIMVCYSHSFVFVMIDLYNIAVADRPDAVRIQVGVFQDSI